jgi:hypothetical protein
MSSLDSCHSTSAHMMISLVSGIFGFPESRVRNWNHEVAQLCRAGGRMTEHVETLVGLISASGQGAPVSAAPLGSIPKWAFIDISSS